MSIERIEIEVREDGSRVVKRNLEAIADQAEATDKAVGHMQGSLGALSRAKSLPTNVVDDVRRLISVTSQLQALGGKGLFDNANISQAVSLIQQMRTALDNVGKGIAGAQGIHGHIKDALGKNVQNVGLGTDFLEQQLNANPAVQAVTKSLEDQARASRDVASAQKMVEDAYGRVLDVANRSMMKTFDKAPGIPDISQLQSMAKQLEQTQGGRDLPEDKARVQALNELVAAQGMLNDALRSEEAARNAVSVATATSTSQQASTTQQSTVAAQSQAASMTNVATATQQVAPAMAAVSQTVQDTTQQVSELEGAVHAVEAAFAKLQTFRPKMSEMPDPEDLTSEIGLTQKKLGRPGGNEEAIRGEISALNELLQAQLRLDQVAANSTGAQTQAAKAVTQTTQAVNQTASASQQATGAINNAAQATQNLGNAATQTATRLVPVGQQVRGCASAVQSLAASATSALPPSNGLVRAAKAQGGAAGGAAGNVLKLGAAWFYVRRALYSLGGVLFLRELKQYSDEWIAVTNRVRISTQTQQEFLGVTQKLYEVSQRTRADLGQIAKVYQRGAQASRELGASQQELINFTEGIGMALAVQGVNAHQAYGALHQLGQALGSARIFAEEFNSINEAAPRILQAVADNVDEASGSVARLKGMVVKGTLSNKQFFEAFMLSLPKLREEFKLAVPTIGQAFTVLNNAMAKYVGETGQATGITTGFARAVMSLARNLDDLLKVLIVFGASSLVAFGPRLWSLLSVATARVWAFTAAIAANPLGAVAVAITAITSALIAFKDDINVTTVAVATMNDSTTDFLAQDWSKSTDYVSQMNDEFVKTTNYVEQAANVTVTFGDYLRVVWDVIKSIGKAIWGFFTDVAKASTESSFGIVSVFSTIGQGMWSMLKGVINSIVGLFRFLVNVTPVILGRLPAAVADVFVQMMNGALTAIEVSVNLLSSLINAFAEKVGSSLKIPELKIERIDNEAKGQAAKLADEISKVLSESFSTDYVSEWGDAIGEAVGGVFDKLTALARKFAIERENAKRATETNLSLPPGAGAPPPVVDNSKEIDKVRQALRALMDELDPIGGAFRKLNDQATTMLDAFRLDPSMYAPWTVFGTKVKELEIKIEQFKNKKGMEKWAGSASAMLDLMKKKMWEAMYPLEAWRKSIEQEKKLTTLSTREKEIASQTIDRINELQSKGVQITQKVIDEVAQETASLYNLNQVQEERNKLLEEFNHGAEAQAVKIQALNQLFKEGKISSEEMGLYIAKMRAEAGNANWSENFIAQLELMEAGVDKFTSAAGKLFGTFVQDFSSGIADAVAQSLVHWTSLKDAIYNVATSALSALISGLIKVGIQMLLMSILGKTLTGIALASTTSAAGVAATAWAPAAALASLATLGTNAVPAEAAIIGTTALAEGLAVGSLVSLEEGGYTGNVGRKQIAGVVHGQEFVSNASATRQYRPLLEAMNSGTTDRMVQATSPRMVSGSGGSGGGSPVVNVIIENNSRAVVEQEESLTPGEIRFLVREEAKRAARSETPRVVGEQLASPNSRISKDLGQHTKTVRRR